MKNKKLAIIGKGTTGCLARLFFADHFDNIDWYYDPNIPPMSVGEGTQIPVPILLNEQLGFNFFDGLRKIKGTVKTGIRKVNWGGENDFFHPFPPPGVSIHFDAGLMQKYVLEEMSYENAIAKKVTADEVDADYVIDCSGIPTDFSKCVDSDMIPVNAVHVTQCFWDIPEFDYTFMIARPYGWVFGIPLQHRCSIGYLYNHNINTLEEVKEDVKNVFEFLNLEPSDTTNSFHFKNYWRKEPFGPRVASSGNNCFFLEPLEATSFTTSVETFQGALNVWKNPHQAKFQTDYFHSYMKKTEQMIMMHYYAGSAYDTEFWRFAKERADASMAEAVSEPYYREIFANIDNPKFDLILEGDIPSRLKNIYDFLIPGGWYHWSFFMNSKELGIQNELKNLALGAKQEK